MRCRGKHVERTQRWILTEVGAVVVRVANAPHENDSMNNRSPVPLLLTEKTKKYSRMSVWTLQGTQYDLQCSGISPSPSRKPELGGSKRIYISP